MNRPLFIIALALWAFLFALIAFTSTDCDKRPLGPDAEIRPRFSATQPIGVGPVAAIWFEDGGSAPRANYLRHKLIAGIWSDGTVVWSGDRRFGGPPYLRGRIAVEKVGAIADRLNSAGFFDLTRQVNFGPDSSYTVIAAQARVVRQWVGSWHDPAVAGIVVGEHGLRSVSDGGDDPPSPAYRHFLKLWAEARAIIEGAIPYDGVATPAVDEAIYRLGK
jgi:hypothetical protein